MSTQRSIVKGMSYWFILALYIIILNFYMIGKMDWSVLPILALGALLALSVLRLQASLTLLLKPQTATLIIVWSMLAGAAAIWLLRTPNSVVYVMSVVLVIAVIVDALVRRAIAKRQ